jgi:hypothetical protein
MSPDDISRAKVSVAQLGGEPEGITGDGLI